ncbi:MAG: hypothetical protein QE271_05245, partial [Bacteriovoracaceae bacterium]|nr:hypothetical protein [Bacteriovoracaceae bacterium]
DEFVLQTSFKPENQTSPTPGKVSYQWLTLGGGMNSSLFRIDIRGESVDQWDSKIAQVKEKFLSLVKISKVQKLQQVELNFPNNRMLNMGEIIDFFAQGQKRILAQATLLPKISEHLKKLTDKLLAQKNLFLLEDYKKELERLKIWLTDLSTDRPDPSFQIPINQFILELDSYRNMIQTATTTPSSAPSTSTAAPAAPPTSP